MLLPLWTRLLALGALVVALVGFGWVKGAAHVEAQYEVLRAKDEAQALANVERLAKKGSEVVLQYVTRVERVQGETKTIIKEIPKYVSAESDARCVVPTGFVRLLAPSDEVRAGLYHPAAGVDDAASGVALSAIAEFVTEARSRFEANAAQCQALQTWAASLGGEGS